MKKFFALLFLMGLSMVVSQLAAQDIDRSFVFIDENGAEIENGATVVRNQVEAYDEETDVIYSGISVKMSDQVTSEFLRLCYNIIRIDNGIYQLCFPIMCSKQTEVGEYFTGEGSLMMNPQNIQSEWFPTDEGACIVNITIEVMSKDNSFPPKYQHLAYGPSLTLRLENVSQLAGDVNGDGNVNISDINCIIDCILSGKISYPAADVNGDGNVNISDINLVIGLILNPAH